MDCSPPGSSVHGILQARILEWVAISFSRGSSRPGIEPRSPALQAISLLLSYQTVFWKRMQRAEGGNVTTSILPSYPDLCQGHFHLLSIYFVQGRMRRAERGNNVNKIWSLHLRSLASSLALGLLSLLQGASSWPGNPTGVSCTTDGFFTN